VSATVTGIYLLARLLAGKPIDISTLHPDDPLESIVERVANANGKGALAVYTEAIKDHPDGPSIAALIRQTDTDHAPGTDPVGGSACTELPTEARPDPDLAAAAAPWLDAYTTYCASVSPMTPTVFHVSGGLWLLATLVARRLRVPMPFADIYPNLYIIWIAPTTIFHKTTGMAVPRGLARHLFPYLLAPQEVTPEALLSDMAGKEPTKADTMTEWEQNVWLAERNFAAQRSLCLDEMSGLLASAGRDYNAGLLEAFLRFYDCDAEYKRSTRGQGRLVIRNAYMSILGASTPRAMAPHITSETLWSNGWWPRHAMLTPDVGFPAYAQPTNSGQPPGDKIIWPLKKLYRRLPEPVWPNVATPLTVRLGPGVFQKWEAFSKALSYDLLRDGLEEQLYGTYGRMPTQVIKLATLLAALDWAAVDDESASPQIEMQHLHRAIIIAETWRASAHRAIEQSAVADENVKLTRLLRQVGRAGAAGITLRELGRNMQDIPKSELTRLVEDAAGTGEIIEFDTQPGPQGGRKTVRYRVALA
jgi:hypothetical protein